MGVHGRRDLGDGGEVAIDHLRDAARVVHGPAAGAAADEEGASGEAEEVLLHVDEEQVDRALVARQGGMHVGLPVRGGRGEQGLLSSGAYSTCRRSWGHRRWGEGEGYC